ncbi:VCBS repeat-containing protein [Micromonospora sp. WMMD1128]|uniref:FG-GAP repeat domain-containing protein n=1 Tax=Micromonospora sp. WMMD1128 TaxID=3015150 RepID=UPI00248C0124|nr:VCBS repeat-containing protein [Micromonospora sp. WMMD1128]WBB75816.1 VCBS repeat-containing protein [Micromonospora sp. WMMD1128]
MTGIRHWARRQAAGLVAIVLLAGMFVVAHTPQASGAQRRALAEAYRMTPLSVGLPGGFPQQTIRKVNQDYRRIAAWISSVGAGVAMNDLDGDGLANDLCLTDPRIDRVVVTPTPGARTERYEPFALDPAPLPMNGHIAPMGCVPGDFDEDGRIDLLVYWWGRSPVLFLARADQPRPGPAAYRPVELVPARVDETGGYAGVQWNTNTVTTADFDGDGHLDIFVGNYFPDGPVLDDTVSGGVTMNRSMSWATNGGLDHLMRFTGRAPDGTPRFTDVPGVLDRAVSAGWTLAASAQDVDGDQLPELYVANDFGPDRLLYNTSTPGKVRLSLVEGEESRAFVPKSKRLGHDSFKGMGVDFGDLDQDGLYDLYVGNITTSFGIQESNFAFVNTARDVADLRRQLRAGSAPWHDRSSALNLAWSGWSWDVKIADFTNRGVPDIVQTSGFVKGTVNRWAQLQELATANDTLLEHPAWWPHVEAGDDIAGGQHLRFHVRGDDGRYVDLSPELGLAVPVPTRGIAVGDADGDGRLDMAVARQWDAPVFYHNDSPDTGSPLSLRLIHEGTAGPAGQPGSPVVGASVTVTTPDGRTLLARVDGGGGHSGRRSFEAVAGLGQVSGPVRVRIDWRDRGGAAHQQELQLTPGRHTLTLGAQAREATS